MKVNILNTFSKMTVLNEHVLNYTLFMSSDIHI